MFSRYLHKGREMQRVFSKVATGRTFLSQSLTEVLKSRSRNIRAFSRSTVVSQLDPQQLRAEWGKPSFEVVQMTRLLDHDNLEKRAKFRKILAEDPLLVPKYNISLDEERELALKRLKKLCDQGFISVLDFKNNPLWIFAAHELAAVVDAAMATKMTVQFNLFGGTVLKLGTERHHNKLLKVTNTYQNLVHTGCTK